jgi:hypothetical protein
MQNQLTNNSNNVNTFVCRKCNGPHITIKCDKDKVATKNNTSITPIENTAIIQNDKQNDKQKHYERRGERRPHFKTTYRVKISDLPIDMTEEEMMELTADWGNIVKLKVLNYKESSTAYVDFGYEDQADYFIKAIDKTPFEYIQINAIRVDSTRQEKTEDN